MTDETRLADATPLIAHLPPASAVIVRHRDMATAACMASALMAEARRYGVLVLVSATRPPIRLYADGVHIPEAAMAHWKPGDIARLRPAFVSASAHSQRAVMRAQRLGADAVLLSPVFATQSHAGARPLGLQRFAAIARAAPLPVIALGGLSGSRLRRVLFAGASGIAGIGLFRFAGGDQ